jgi:PGF-CTERM protein
LNRNSLRESEPLEPGEPYEIDLPLQPVDYVFEAGHRLGFVLYSSDYNVTKRPPNSPELTLHLAESTIPVPIVGGKDKLTASLSEADDTGDSGSAGGRTTNKDPSNENSTGEDNEGGADDSGPGFGIGAALTGIGGAGYLLKRQRGSESKED